MLTRFCRTVQLWPRTIARSSTTTEDKTAKDIFSSDSVSFGRTSISEFIRAILVLRICSLPGFADNAEKVLTVARTCLGYRLFTTIMRATAYGQFVAGNSFDEIKRTTDKLNRGNVTQMLAVSIEDASGDPSVGQNDLVEENFTKVISCIETARDICPHGKDALMQLKLTAVMPYNCLVELSTHINAKQQDSNLVTTWLNSGGGGDILSRLLPDLPRQTVEDVALGGQKLLSIVEHAEKCNVSILIDAEYTWINPAIQQISMALMMIFNQIKPVVYDTYQGYLKETRKLIQNHAKVCRDARVYFCFKLVRGAYLLSETTKYGSHPPWLCDDWSDTNRNYDNCLRDALGLDVETTRVLLATHNEQSVRMAVELLQKRTISPGAKSNVAFAQLYGMADYMSYTLGRMGYDIYKSLPYGNLEEVLPYLCRRAKENTLFLSGIRKEMEMLKIGLYRKIMKNATNEDDREAVDGFERNAGLDSK